MIAEDLLSFDRVVLVDTSWVAYRGLHAFDMMATTHKGQELKTGHVFILCRLAGSLAKDKRQAIVFCRDFVPKAKLEAVGHYKDQRPDLAGGSVSGSYIDSMTLVTNLPNVFACQAADHEADDVIACLAKELIKRNQQVVIYSSDNDFLQLLKHPNVRISRDMKRDKLLFVTESYVSEKYGVPYEQLPVFRTLTGDTSDNVIGIPNMPKDLARIISATCLDFALFPRYYTTIKNNLTVKSHHEYLRKIRQQYSRLLENYKTIHSMDSISIASVPIQLTASINPGKGSTVARKYGFSLPTRQNIGLN